MRFGDAPLQGDDADFLSRPLTLSSVLAAHNEHPVVLFFPLWKVLYEAVDGPGLIMIAIFLLHTLSGLALYRLAGLGSLAVWVFLGSGAQNLGWPFQLGWVMSVTLGLWALVVESHRVRAIFLTASVLSSTLGLFFVAAAAVWRPSRLLAAPILAYASWWLVARETVHAQADVMAHLPGWPAFVILGPGVATGAFLGVGIIVGTGLFLAYVAWVVARRGAIEPIARAGIVGLAALYLALAIGRTGYGLEYAAEGRYVYVAAAFLLLVLVDLRAPLRSAVLGVALAANVIALVSVEAWWRIQ
jgi:hypothetical protein